MAKQHKQQKKRPLISGFILLGLGILLLLGMYDIVHLEDSWPVLIIMVGLGLIIGAVFRKDPKAPPAEGPHQS